MSDNAVEALAVFCIFGAPVAAFVIMRVLSHRERIEMIRRGMVPPPGMFYNKKAWRNMNVGEPGMSVPPQPLPTWVPGPSDRDSPERSLRKGIMISLVGFAIVIGVSFFGYDSHDPFAVPHPGPHLLFGLIPMFVGIAQIIIALLSGARLGPVVPPPPMTGPPPGSSTPPGKPHGYVYEPEPNTHSGYEELSRPVPPPERR